MTEPTSSIHPMMRRRRGAGNAAARAARVEKEREARIVAVREGDELASVQAQSALEALIEQAASDLARLRSRYYQEGNGPMFGWATQRAPGEEQWWSFVYAPVGCGARSDRATQWTLDTVSQHRLRRDARDRAHARFEQWKEHGGTPWR